MLRSCVLLRPAFDPILSRARPASSAAGEPPARLPPEAAPGASPALPPALLLSASALAWARSWATRPSTVA
eukprot:2285-Pyramimonas_sp.AAC.1